MNIYFLIFSSKNQKKGITRKLINLFMMKSKQKNISSIYWWRQGNNGRIEATPYTVFLRSEHLCAACDMNWEKDHLYGYCTDSFPYRILPFDSCNILLCIYLRGESKCGVGRRKTTWNYHVKYRRISKHICAHRPIAHLIQWIRCDNDNEKPSPAKRPSKTIFIRLYGFVFVCRFQLNSDWKLTCLHSTPLHSMPCHHHPRFGEEFHVAVSLSSIGCMK